MASTCSQPIAHSYPNASIVELDFQFPKPPSFSDASIFGYAARFNLSAMDVPASMNGRHFQAPPAVGQPSSSACTAELSEYGEIFDSRDDDDDDHLPSVRQILGFPCESSAEAVRRLSAGGTKLDKHLVGLKPRSHHLRAYATPPSSPVVSDHMESYGRLP
jgi:hypothetical protein